MVKVLLLFVLSATIIFDVLGQVYDFTNLELLPYNVNTEAHEIFPLMSSDGTSLFFTRLLSDYNTGGKYSGHDIWVTEQLESGWKKASNTVMNFNSSGNEAIIGVSKNGTGVYFMKTIAGRNINGIYYAKRIKGIWEEAEFVRIEGIETSGNIGFYMHPDGATLLISMKSITGQGQEDIFVCLKNSDGSWGKPKNLGSSINTTGYELAPFLSEDKRRLFFTSNGHQGLGDGDIFYADRLYDSWETWSIPRNLGEPVNSKFFDGYFSIYKDSVAYFASNRTNKSLDIYSARVGFTKQVLLDNQRYLAPNEYENIIPSEVSLDLSFANGNVELSSAQVELIWFVANRILLRRELKVHIMAIQEEKEGVSAERVKNIAAQFEKAGIDIVRILQINPGPAEKVDKTGVVTMRLFR